MTLTELLMGTWGCQEADAPLRGLAGGGLQLQNKQDWARLFGYEVHQMAELVDGHMRPGPWQKVGLLRKVRPRLRIPAMPPCLPRSQASCRRMPGCRKRISFSVA
jgi:hypothetical protein